jgi:pimeloyl-ACP methyl ester carboxylesterase
MENLSNSFEPLARPPIFHDDTAKKWPVAFEERTVTTRYGQTHVVVSGNPSAPAMLLLGPESAFAWGPIIAPLSARRRTYALDTRFDDPLACPKRGNEYSAWLSDLEGRLGIEAADVVGGSLGGWIAMNHAICAPSRVRRLLLLAPEGLSSWLSTVGSLARLVAGGAALADQPSRISTSRLRRIEAPTLILLGSRDDAADRANMHISACEVVMLPSAAHVMGIDAPAEVAARMVRFLDVH